MVTLYYEKGSIFDNKKRKKLRTSVICGKIIKFWKNKRKLIVSGAELPEASTKRLTEIGMRLAENHGRLDGKIENRSK